MLENFIRFVMVILFILIILSFIFRIKVYGDIYKTMKKYPREFETLGIDKYLLYVPEFCNLKKVRAKLDMSNYEIFMLMKKLSFTKWSLWGSSALLFIVGLLIYFFGKN